MPIQKFWEVTAFVSRLSTCSCLHLVHLVVQKIFSLTASRAYRVRLWLIWILGVIARSMEKDGKHGSVAVGETLSRDITSKYVSDHGCGE